jgi:LPS export ABC transporter protein LptC
MIVFIAYLSFIEIKDKSGNLQKDIEMETSAFAELSDVFYIKSNKDFTEFEITAKNAEYFKKGGASSFEDIEVQVYTKDGSEYHLTGDRGTYNAKKGIITIKGDVVMKSESGYELKADSLFYSYIKKLITTKDKVIIKMGDITFEGVGMRLNLQKERLLIKNKVKGHVE